jgi:MoaA/NifB/PqqE/SkfB family radical SAM enzyme
MRPVPVSPRDVHLLVTARCNLACRHCSVYGEGETEGDLAAEQWVSIIRRLAEWKVLKLTISGGEPLVREDLPEIIEAVLSRPFRFSLNTNAMLVTDDLARVLARAAPRLESVMVSLDGARAETHDEQRAPGAFEAMAEGGQRLRRAGVPVGFYCTVTRLNVREIEDIAQWGVSRGSYVKFNDVLSVGRACADRELALDPVTRREGEAVDLARRAGDSVRPDSARDRGQRP